MANKKRAAGRPVWQVRATNRSSLSDKFYRASRRTSRQVQCAPGEVVTVPQHTVSVTGEKDTGLAVYFNSGIEPKIAGVFYDDDKSFRRQAKQSHILKCPPGLAFQAEIVQKLEALSCRELVVSVQEQNCRYRCSMDTFLQHGVPLNRGFGEQIMLELSHWTIENMAQPRLPFDESGGGLQ